MTTTVQDIMTKDPIVVKTKDSLSQVIYKLSANNIDHLPVVDKNNKIRGIVSKTDMYQRAMNLTTQTSGRAYNAMILENTGIEEVMTYNPVTISPLEPIMSAVELLLKGNFHALPVVSKDHVIGIVTSQDILEYIAQPKH